VIWTIKPATHTLDKWLKSLHVNITILIHPPSRVHFRCPKVYVIGEPSIGPIEMKHRTVVGVVTAPMCALLVLNSKWLVWCNRPCPERNSEGHCLALDLEWLVELVVLGLANLLIQRRENGEIKAINGFRLLQ
jgi:hypothetical protein